MKLFELFAELRLDSSSFERGLKSVAHGMRDFSEKVGKMAATAAKVGAVAVSAAGAAVYGLTKSALDGVGDLEQQIGGS